MSKSKLKIVQITPGAGGMYCGNCFRDNALVRTLRQMGHETLMVPLYLPMTLEDEDQSAGTPIFFSGVNVYLEQISSIFRRMPNWLHRWLASPRVLQWAAGRAAKTRAQDVGDLLVSMLRGEEGKQARELDELAGWLKSQRRPDVICLSNALLVGMARQLKHELGAPIICALQGEDAFLDALPVSHRDLCWKTLSERASEVDLFVAPSRYFAERMASRIGVPAWRMRVVHNGINLDGFGAARSASHFLEGGADAPVVGFFARMCREKGLDTLVEAYLLLKRLPEMQHVRLHIGGGCGPSDKPFVETLKQRLQTGGVLNDVRFFPNVDRAGKLEFFRGLTLLSTPALYGEAFGLYVIEAMAGGVPVVQPRVASFPELIEITGGGVLCEPGNPKALADALAALLAQKDRTREMGRQAQVAVREKFSLGRMASEMVKLYEEAASRKLAPTQ
jgi:glycosyltransferase involved in cell wall biosynthesis